MQVQTETHRSTLNHKVALKALFNIMELWGLSVKERQVLLGIPLDNRDTYNKWKNGKVPHKLNVDKEERVSHLLGIYKDLQILFSDPARADRWVKRPNKFFNGKTALEVMLGGSILDIARVRSYLDTARG